MRLEPEHRPRHRLFGRVGAVAAFGLAITTGACRSDSEPPRREVSRASETPADPAAGVRADHVALEPGDLRIGSPEEESCRGDEETPTEARVPYRLEVGRFEVGQREFERRMGFDPSFNVGCEDCPVDSVTHDDAAAYCNALSAEAGLEPCYACEETEDAIDCRVASDAFERCPGFRLPTELEWEFAARAGTRGATYVGPITSCMSTDDVADQIGWYKARSGGRTHPRGQKQPNPWGLYDMAGNVYEWTEGVVNPESDVSSEDDPAASFRILRGGSWYHNAHHMRAASRLRVPPGRRLSYAGFRCVRTLPDAG